MTTASFLKKKVLTSKQNPIFKCFDAGAYILP